MEASVSDAVGDLSNKTAASYGRLPTILHNSRKQYAGNFDQNRQNLRFPANAGPYGGRY